MTREKASGSRNDASAEAETRVLPSDDAAVEETDPELAETVLATIGDEPESDVIDEAVQDLDKGSRDDPDSDLTQLVTHAGEGSASASELDATRVIDPAALPATSNPQAEADAATRVVDPSDDKTFPPSASRNIPASGPSAPPPPPTPIDNTQGLTPGSVLFGEYQIVNVLGVGGMGEVYRAHHRRLDEHRAIKVMHANLSGQKGASEFFYREAKALLAVRHPAVVHCHDLLSDDAGRVFLIMEMIEGIPLSAKMNDGPLSPDEVAILGARVSHGLSAAHRKGVIHRDVSPDNIVLPRGRVQEAKLIDFGIAKILQEGEGTIVDGFKGKLSYASPEQLGFFGGKIDGRSDFYSLGLVLVAAAMGRPLSMGTTVMEAVDARRSFDALPDAIPVGLRSAIAPLLKLDPDDRPEYVDRLFVVPGGMEGSADSHGYADAARVARGRPPAGQFNLRRGLFVGIVAALSLLVAGGLYLALGTETAISPQASTTDGPTEEIFVGRVEVGAVPIVSGTNRVEVESPVPSEPDVVVVSSPAPQPKKPRRLTAGERIKMIGLLKGAQLSLAENQLMSPANDNAYDRYQKVLAMDPDNQKARDGLRAIADRYLSLLNTAVDKGHRQDALTFLARAKKADSTHPGIDSAESRLSR
ncbi:MAG TPA: serine/threonine protein kinase [Myxococcales bacterium]|nr:serine/threonine protein kinase [Myxococcales bacterium]